MLEKVWLSYHYPCTSQFLDLPSSLPIFSFLRHVKLPNNLAFSSNYLLRYPETKITFLLILTSIFFPCLLFLFYIFLLQASISIFFFSLLLLIAIIPIIVKQKVRFSKQPNLPMVEQFDMLVKVEALKALLGHPLYFSLIELFFF